MPIPGKHQQWVKTKTFFQYSRLNQKFNTFPVIEGRNQSFDVTLGTPKPFIARGMCDETWELTVRPVLREQKDVVKRLLLEEGLPKLAEWLSAERTPAWLHGGKNFTILFAPETQKLSYPEDGTP